MLKGYDIVCFGDDYGRMPSTFQRIANELSRENRILWVNSLAERKMEISLRDIKRGLEKIMSFGKKKDIPSGNVTVLSPVSFPLYYARGLIGKLNLRLVLFQLNRALERSGFKQPIIMTSVRGVFDIINAMPKKMLAYFCMDDYLLLYADDSMFLECMEKQLMRLSDVVFATSRHLVKKAESRGARSIQYIGQGVDYKHFSKAQSDIEIAADIRNIKGPVIGFFGTLGHWVDLELIEKIAAHNPEWSVVLIGRKEADLSGLEAKNIHILGNKDYDMLPAYIKKFDCTTIPFKMDGFSLYVNPIKGLECLASGKPVVSTYLPDLEDAGDLMYLVKSHSEFIKCVERAISEKSPELTARRLEFSKRYTWEIRAELVSGFIQGGLK